MTTAIKEKDIVTVTQYVTDKKGQKVAAILDIKELNRIERLLEDLSGGGSGHEDKCTRDDRRKLHYS